MATEIERKYLAKDPHWRPEGTPLRLVQGYLWSGETATARVVQEYGTWALNLTLMRTNVVYFIPLPAEDAAELLTATAGEPMGSSWVLRIRTEGTAPEGIFCLKGKGQGISRPEYEYALSAEMTRELLAACAETHIMKDRYRLDYEGYVWEVDVYQNPLPDGPRVTIEVELPDETTTPPLPAWVGEEVSHIKAYANAALARRRWKAAQA